MLANRQTKIKSRWNTNMRKCVCYKKPDVNVKQEVSVQIQLLVTRRGCFSDTMIWSLWYQLNCVEKEISQTSMFYVIKYLYIISK